MSLRPAHEALLTAAIVSVAVTVASALLPPRWVASAVGAVFLGATWVMVLRRDDAAVERAGLSFGGLVLPEAIDVRRVGRDLRVAAGWASLLALVCFGPFYVGFRVYARVVWHAHPGPLVALHPITLVSDAIGQLALIALPEEAFYRGYLQTRLDEAWPARVRVLGAEVGPSLVATSAIFAVGHLLTIHDAGRLAVFFPSLLFGWLRARTGGVGASITFHAACNLFSSALVGLYAGRG